MPICVLPHPILLPLPHILPPARRPSWVYRYFRTTSAASGSLTLAVSLDCCLREAPGRPPLSFQRTIISTCMLFVFVALFVGCTVMYYARPLWRAARARRAARAQSMSHQEGGQGSSTEEDTKGPVDLFSALTLTVIVIIFYQCGCGSCRTVVLPACACFSASCTWLAVIDLIGMATEDVAL